MQKTIIAACLLALSATSFATAEHDTPAPVKPAKVIKSARATSTNTIGITANPSAYFGQSGGAGGNVAGSGNAYVNSERSAASATASAPPAAIGTCAASGLGLGVQGAGAGVALSSGTGVEIGCDLARDLTILSAIGASQDEKLARACMKPELAKALGRKCPKAEAAPIQQPAPWMYGG